MSSSTSFCYEFTKKKNYKQNKKKKTLSTKYLGTKEHVLCVVDCTKLHILFIISFIDIL